jgi:hypothetical protein
MKTTLVAGLLAVVLVSGAWAGPGGNPSVIPPQAHYNGMTYAEWSVAWWRWLISIPTDTPQNPFGPQNGPDCGNGANAGKVWFLVGFFVPLSDPPTVRTCNIPVGTALFFPIYNTECSTVEPDPFHLDLNHPTTCVNSFFNGDFQSLENLKLTIDAQSINLNWDSHLITSKIFDFSLPNPLANPPKDNNALGVLSDACTKNPDGSPNLDGCQAKSKGYWIMLPPLSKGNHTIAFSADRRRHDGSLKNPVNTRYNIQVVDKGKKK